MADLFDLERFKKRQAAKEGYKYFCYDDKTGKSFVLPTGGKVTIGIGRNLSGRGLSDDEIDYLFANDVKLITKQLDDNMPWWRDMSGPRQNVLAEMCFNMGLPVLKTFINTLRMMQTGDYEAAASGMKASAWHNQVGIRAVELETSMRDNTWPV